MIVFAILGLLIGLLFMFVRQKIGALESKVNLLTDTVQTMAGLNRLSYEADDEDDEDDDEDEDDDDEDEDEDEEMEMQTITLGGNRHVFEDNEVEKQIVSDDEADVLDVVELNEVKEVEIKKINLEGPDYESLTLKELKDKVTELGGPKLRTKKELLDFLKK